MSNKVSAKTIPVGTRVSYPHYGFTYEGVILTNNSNNGIMIGFQEQTSFGAWAISTYENLKLIDIEHNCVYGWWLGYEDQLMILEDDKKVLLPDQHCIDCKLPAPHAQPNAGFGFVCVSCVVLRDIV